VSAPAAPRSAFGLDALSGWAFVLLAVSLTGPIAPMGIATALCGALTLVSLVRRRGTWPRTPVDAAAIAWMAALVLAAVFAQDRAASLPRIHKGFFPLLIGLAAFHARDRRVAERAIGAYLAAASAVAVFGIAVWIAQGSQYASRARGLSGHYMTFAGQLLLELLLAAGIAIGDSRPRWRIGASLTALLTLAALAVTFTRSAWIGLFVGFAVIAGLVQPLALAALALLAGGAFAFAPHDWRARLMSIFDPMHPWNRQRVYMWDAGLRMFRDHPLTGVGLQDMHALYDKYRAPGSTERAGHLHDVFIQIAASMGIAGLAAFGWLYASFLRVAGGGLRGQLRGGGLGAGVRLGVFAGLAGFIVAGLFEWNFGDEELLYGLYTLVGLAWAARAWDRGEG
jgi:O-antigen ligase